MINNVHILRDDEAAIKPFKFACDTLKSAKNCEQAGFLHFHKDKTEAKIFFDKACNLNKNYCMGEVILRKDLANFKKKCNENNIIACISYIGAASEDELKSDEKQTQKSVDKICELLPNFNFERVMSMFKCANDFEKFRDFLDDVCEVPLMEK